MRTRVVIIALALTLGGLSAVFAGSYLSSAENRLSKDAETVRVLVAQQDVPRGMIVSELFAKKLVALEPVPRQFVASDAISSARAVDGQVLAVPLSAGEQVTATRFQFPSNAGLSYTVPEDYMAISIPVDKASGLAGLVRAGDSVAVMATLEGNEGGDGRSAVTSIIVPKARILAIDGATGTEAQSTGKASGGIGSGSGSGGGMATVTLSVSPADAQKLILSETIGVGESTRRLWLALLPVRGNDMENQAPQTSGQLIRTVNGR